MKNKKALWYLLAIMMVFALIASACQPAATPTEAPPEPEEPAEPVEPEEPEEPEEPAMEVVFFSTQFSPVEEQEKFRAILQEGGFDVTASEEGPLLDLVIAGAQAGQGEVDVVGALHGSFPPLAREDAMMNMIDVAEDLEASGGDLVFMMDEGVDNQDPAIQPQFLD